MGFSLLKVIAVGVVNAVAARPAVVRHQQCAVKQESNDAFNASVRVKRVVATFVGQDPAAHGDGAATDAVKPPQRSGLEGEGNLRSDP